MSLRDLVEPECGGANPLMRLGSHLMQDAAYKDQGISGRPAFVNRPLQDVAGGPFGADQLVHEFLGQIAAVPPQTFRMDALLQEMRAIDAHQFHPHVVRAPPVIEEVNNGTAWVKEFTPIDEPIAATAGNELFLMNQNKGLDSVWNQTSHRPPVVDVRQENANFAKDFFDQSESLQNVNYDNGIPQAAGAVFQTGMYDPEQYKYSEFMRFMRNVNDGNVKIEDGHVMAAEEFFAAHKNQDADAATADWVKDFEEGKQSDFESTENFNSQFWNRLQNEWKKISEEDDKGHPWLSEFSEYYDPYKEYTFDEENPLGDIENALEKGKAFLRDGDIPSAVLCFESAVKQDPSNAEIWELLGTSQAENEKDPNAIAALKKSLELNPNNPKVMMALAVSYTNESLQSQALKMLISWLKCNNDYPNIIPPNMQPQDENVAGAMASSIIRGPELKEVQELFLKAVQQKHPAIDADIQEALGVLFNLSSEYDKAADCFRAALHVRTDSAKTWNRLGASLANGNQSVDAVDAYQRALHIQPGFIRARYNVGIICINLKAYKEAAEHFLIALNHQANSMARSGLNKVNPSNQMSDTIWSTMRMAISLMGRLDLQPALDKRDLSALNEAFESVAQ